MENMIRSSKHYIKETNKGKISLIGKLYDDSKIVVQHYIGLILEEKIPLKNQLSSKAIPNFNGISGGQWKQVLYANASSIVRSNEKSVKKRVYNRYKKVYAYFREKGRQDKFTSKKFRELSINYYKRMKFDLNNLSINLDSRFVNLQEGKSFDHFLQIKTPYIVDGKVSRRISVNIPIKEHRHSLKYKGWDRVKTVRLSKDEKDRFYFCFVYEKEIEYKQGGKPVGLDIGYKKLIALSNGETYGNHLEDLYKKIANKKRGSKNYKQVIIHKENEINRVINNINFKDCQNIFVEDLKYVKHKSKLSSKFMNKLQYWTYSSVLSKLERLGEEEGFFVSKVNPAYTSQICSNCGVQDKTNRDGELYSCKSCGYEIDADINGAINILYRGVYSPPTENQFHDFS